MGGPSKIQVRGVTKRYGAGPETTITAADAIDLDVESGAIMAVTGPSGSGKSTLLHLIGALERPDAGTIVVDGTEVTGLPAKRLADYRRRIGFVFQRFNLLPTLSAVDNVIAPVLPYRTNFHRRERARELLASVGLAGREDALPSRLSGGQQQRVAIARALINAPSLLLDEPTGNLDSHTGKDIIDILFDMRDRHGTTIMIATHDIGIGDRCDSVVRISDGRLEPALPSTPVSDS